MDILEKKNKYNKLFDFYGCLLTVKQQEYFTQYYFEDLSLAEIAEIYNVSRNAVYDQLNKIYNLLDYYEANLHLSAKYEVYDNLLEEYKSSSNKDVIELINKLRSME